MPDVIADFRAALEARGLCPATIDADGTLHRCPVEGAKSGRKDGSYLLHLDGLPAGGFDNWRDGLGWQNWHAKSDPAKLALGADELRSHRARMVQIQEQRRMDEETRHCIAAKRAGRLWLQARPASNARPYLLRKSVNAYGVRQLREQIVIPLRDVSGIVWSLQFIAPDGSKRFLTGGRKRGCYFAIGVPDATLCICEGYATAASVREATGHAVAVAFDAGNLEPVARALRAKLPGVAMIVCADNDTETPGNPGVSRALAAARAVGGEVAIPQFDGETHE